MKKTKVMSAKRSFFMSVLSLVLCFAMLLGTTWAWFTDSVTSGKNRIIAGNLDVELEHYTTDAASAETVKDATDLFGIELWEPGVIAYENFVVKNVGNLALKYKLNLNIFDKNSMAGHDLSEVIKVAVVEGGFSGDRAAAQALTGYVSLADFQECGNLAAGASAQPFGVVLYWEPTDSDNDYNVNNGKNTDDSDTKLWIDFGINLVATQDTVEADSFDHLYDKMAEFPVVAEAAVEAGKTTTLKAYDANNVLAASATISADDNTVPAGSKIKMEVTETDKPATVSISDCQETLNLDVKFFKVADSGEKTPITEFNSIVNVDLSAVLPNGAIVEKVYHTHDGASSEMTKVSSVADVTDGKFFFDTATKTLTIGSKTFSPFTLVYSIAQPIAVNINNTDERYLNVEELNTALSANKSVRLLDDVDMSGSDWTMVENYSGTFDGDGKTISNLTLSNADGIAAMFYSIADGAQFNNLKFESVSIEGKYACVLVGDAETAKNIFINNVEIASGSVEGSKYAAGIAFDMEGSGDAILNCVNRAAITSDFSASGIAGWPTAADMQIVNCINYADISGSNRAGGIAANCGGTLKNCKNYGNVIQNMDNAGSAFGGLIGVASAAMTIEDCINCGNVTSISANVNSSAAGILAQTPSSKVQINRCVNTGNITAQNSLAGGIGVSLYGNINCKYCYNSGNVSSNGYDAGGIVPKAPYGSSDTATQCVNTGSVTANGGKTAYQLCNNKTNSYYYSNETLYNGDATVCTDDIATTVLQTLSDGLETPFWGIDTDNMIKPISLISAD